MGLSFYVTGGRHCRNAREIEEWVSFDQAQLFKVDVEAGELLRDVNYESPADHRPDEHHRRIAATVSSGYLIVHGVDPAAASAVILVHRPSVSRFPISASNRSM